MWAQSGCECSLSQELRAQQSPTLAKVVPTTALCALPCTAQLPPGAIPTLGSDHHQQQAGEPHAKLNKGTRLIQTLLPASRSPDDFSDSYAAPHPTFPGKVLVPQPQNSVHLSIPAPCREPQAPEGPWASGWAPGTMGICATVAFR